VTKRAGPPRGKRGAAPASTRGGTGEGRRGLLGTGQSRFRVRAPCRQASPITTPTAIHCPRPLHRQTAYASFPIAGNGLPVSERTAGEALSLPIPSHRTNFRQLIEAIGRAAGGEPIVQHIDAPQPMPIVPDLSKIRGVADIDWFRSVDEGLKAILRSSSNG
jgi:hypothetical protein